MSAYYYFYKSRIWHVEVNEYLQKKCNYQQLIHTCTIYIVDQSLHFIVLIPAAIVTEHRVNFH